MQTSLDWRNDHRLWVEAFALLNLAGLAPDIYLAHNVNSFRHSAEYAPLVFSIAAPVLLLVALLFLSWSRPAPWQVIGYLIGWTSVGIGVAGLVYHLESQFFQERTMASLVYSAPFAAPLSYTGIGLLLVMNRMVAPAASEWPLWVILLSLGGFAGNFVFSVTDHAQNGFFRRTEWIPVISSAFAVGFLTIPLIMRVRRTFLALAAVILGIQGAVGILGFYYHLTADLHAPGARFIDKIIYGAPVLAPLLFPDLVLLALVGLWTMYKQQQTAMD